MERQEIRERESKEMKKAKDKWLLPSLLKAIMFRVVWKIFGKYLPRSWGMRIAKWSFSSAVADIWGGDVNLFVSDFLRALGEKSPRHFKDYDIEKELSILFEVVPALRSYEVYFRRILENKKKEMS